MGRAWEEPLTLIGSSEAQIAEARIDLARIGMQVEAGHVANPAPMGLALPCRPGPGFYAVGGFDDLLERRRAGCKLVVVDVREAREWRAGHLPDSVHIPFHQLTDRVGELPDGRMLWVHCAAGFRAALAVSLLARLGRRVVLVDDRWAAVAPEEVEVQSEAA